MTTLGISILAHKRLDRVAELALALERQGCRIAIHVDRKTDQKAFSQLKTALSGYRLIVFADRRRCQWGQFSLVEAQIDCARLLLNHFDDVTYICQISGSCLPLRPVSELREYLSSRPGTDHIVSESAYGAGWIKDGLKLERFTLHFPFGWKRQRWLFDLSVSLQRRLKIKRNLPEGLKPHLGSQWWCLTRETLQRILDDPRRQEYDRFFRKSWIPDESYFQTLVRKHSRNIVSRSLSFVHFDYEGKPAILYDDHLEALRGSDYFFARKAWAGADKLYTQLLSAEPLAASRKKFMALKARMNAVEHRRKSGRPGLRMQSRHPHPSVEPALTGPAEYITLIGLDSLIDGLEPWARNQLGLAMPGSGALPGGLRDTNPLKSNEPRQFLQSLIRNVAPARLGIHLRGQELLELGPEIARDQAATIFHIRGAWLLDLLQSYSRFQGPAITAALKLQLEEKQLWASYSKSDIRAQVIRIDLPEFLAAPHEFLFQLAEASGVSSLRALPVIKPFVGISDLAMILNNAGVQIDNSWHEALAAVEKQAIASEMLKSAE